MLPDLAGLPGPGQMNEYVQADALKPLDDVLDITTYTSETAPGLVKLGQVNGKTDGVFIKAAVKGLIWYNPKLHDYSQRRPATWDDLHDPGHGQQGQGQGAVVPGRRVRRRVRLAGHGLDRGHRPAPGRS